MGFGFNPTNIERLNLRFPKSGKAVAMSIGLGRNEQRRISEGSQINFYEENRDCIYFVREFINWT